MPPMKSPSSKTWDNVGPQTFDHAVEQAELALTAMTYTEYKAAFAIATVKIGQILNEAERIGEQLGKPVYDYHIITLLAAMLIRVLEIVNTCPSKDGAD